MLSDAVPGPHPDGGALASPLSAAPDWAQPWFTPWARAGQAALARHAAGQPLTDALNATGDAPVRFVPPQALPPGAAYERFIFDSGAVPTRTGWHDFFNALVWLGLPVTKRHLNRLQAAEIARDGVQARRGPVRDAITVFDENGALLHAPDALWNALAERRWAELFGPLRPLWREASFLLFGHAALEKLLAPYKSITVHVLRVDAPFDAAGDLRALDAALADALTPERLATKPFVPLPVLGVPGWWPANADPAFYADVDVFRPLRRHSE
ncbi:DUF3025 domain-containing protein [Ottowia sp. GY511]|uniref:DUF3025 domain-containing protein n=1 Tax=Ottowia flava TaxID=2675430 RepID=A0ABW4KZN3_9BURK|nr:DUF3025 domain-containing protein [Ottowia sp. GY511]TXK31183.1 DUF3025 domain-containing protein [Ottowia sp. GY511]